MANIRDVAKRAGVSISTVSRVLAKDPAFKVTEQTRKNVLQAAGELGYVYSPAPRPRKRYSLGCILPWTSEKYEDPFFQAIYQAAEAECVRQGAVFSTLRFYNELLDRQVLSELLEEDLAGLLVMEQVSPEIHAALAERFPHIVYVDSKELSAPHNAVGYDRIPANRQAMDCLLAHGYRRIAIIAGSSPDEELADTTRLWVYREALRKAGIPYDEELVKDCQWNLEKCGEQVRELMALPEPPEAIYAASDNLASAVLSTIYDMGLRCPKDVGVIGFNDLSLSGHLIPPLTTIDVPLKDIGQAAGERLMQLIRGEDPDPRRILFPTTLVERKSLKNIRNKEDR